MGIFIIFLTTTFLIGLAFKMPKFLSVVIVLSLAFIGTIFCQSAAEQSKYLVLKEISSEELLPLGEDYIHYSNEKIMYRVADGIRATKNAYFNYSEDVEKPYCVRYRCEYSNDLMNFLFFAPVKPDEIVFNFPESVG